MDEKDEAVLERLTISDFEPHVGTTFASRLADGTSLGLVLTSVTRLSEGTRVPNGRVPFSLAFETEAGVRASQGMLALRLPAGDEVAIFVVPIANAPSGGLVLEAIFT